MSRGSCANRADCEYVYMKTTTGTVPILIVSLASGNLLSRDRCVSWGGRRRRLCNGRSSRGLRGGIRRGRRSRRRVACRRRYARRRRLRGCHSCGLVRDAVSRCRWRIGGPTRSRRVILVFNVGGNVARLFRCSGSVVGCGLANSGRVGCLSFG